MKVRSNPLDSRPAFVLCGMARLVFRSKSTYDTGMTILRIILLCVLALGPVGMVSAGAGGDAAVGHVDCHGVTHDHAPGDETDMPARHCAGMGCCVMIEQAMLTITPVWQQLTPDYRLTVASVAYQAQTTRLDRPPRTI